MHQIASRSIGDMSKGRGAFNGPLDSSAGEIKPRSKTIMLRQSMRELELRDPLGATAVIDPG